MSWDWNDLRCFLAVARAGSTLAASRALGVSQSTVARRIEALEYALGATLFERLPSGYRLTGAGRTAVEGAERVEREAQAFAAAFPTAGRRASGPLRVATNDILAQAFVGPALTTLRRTQPDIAVELLVGDAFLDLLRGEADLALRAGTMPDDPGLIRQKMPTMPWGVYASRAYRDEHGAPADKAALSAYAVVLGRDGAARIPAVAWFGAVALQGRVTRANTLAGLLGAVKTGLGVSILPRPIGDGDPDLALCFAAEPEFEDNIWLAYPAALRGEPRVRKLADAIAQRFREARTGSA